MDHNLRDRLQYGTIITAAAIAVCALSIICLVLLRLHTKFSYRLALYQVLSALIFGMACIGAFYAFPSESGTNSVQCKAFAFVGQYTLWVEIVFTACLTFHLFSYSVFFKNLAKCEILYLLCSLLVPLALAIVPFVKENYGPSDAWCWIQVQKQENNTLIYDDTAVIVQFVILYGPAFAILLVCTGAVFVMGTILAYRAFRTRVVSFNSGQQQHQQLLRQLLPLMVYPILFFLFFLAPFTECLYMVHEANRPPSLIFAAAFCIIFFSMAPGIALLVHMVVVFLITRRRRSCGRRLGRYVCIDGEGTATRGTTRNIVSLNSETNYIIPNEN